VNYTDLINDLIAWMARDDLPNNTFIALAEAELNRAMRLQAMETQLRFTPAVQDTRGLWYEPFPEDFLELKHIESSALRMKYVTNTTLASGQYGNGTQDSWYGGQEVYSIANQQFLFTGQPVVDITYYEKFPVLSLDNLTNWYTDNLYDGLLYLALHHAGLYIREPNEFKAQAMEIVATAQAKDDQARISGAPLTQMG
jgi:hypothetical protein